MSRARKRQPQQQQQNDNKLASSNVPAVLGSGESSRQEKQILVVDNADEKKKNRYDNNNINSISLSSSWRWLRRQFPALSSPSSSCSACLPTTSVEINQSSSTSTTMTRRVCQGFVALVLLIVLHQGIVHLCRPTSSSWTTGNILIQPQPQMPSLDFVVAGFPKCGTTTLLYAFAKLPEHILMSNREVCAMKDQRRPELTVHERYRRELRQAWSLPDDVKADKDDDDDDARHRGIKCPTILYSDKAIDRLLQWYPSPFDSAIATAADLSVSSAVAKTTKTTLSEVAAKELKWIVGMRHPMRQVLSYYNYLVTEVYDKGYWLYKGIHSLESILLVNDANPWKDMAADTHQYEIHLERLLSRLLLLQQQQKEEHQKNPLVLLYSLEQLEAAEKQNKPGAASPPLVKDMSTFVGLPSPDSSENNNSNNNATILRLGHENRNHFTGQRAHTETIDLCATTDTSSNKNKNKNLLALRSKLLQDSIRTATWMEDNILAPHAPYSSLVQIGGGVDEFRTQLQSWKLDICL